MHTTALQEHKGALKVVKVEHDTNKGLVERYKARVWQIACICAFTCAAAATAKEKTTAPRQLTPHLVCRPRPPPANACRCTVFPHSLCSRMAPRSPAARQRGQSGRPRWLPTSPSMHWPGRLSPRLETRGRHSQQGAAGATAANANQSCSRPDMGWVCGPVRANQKKDDQHDLVCPPQGG